MIGRNKKARSGSATHAAGLYYALWVQTDSEQLSLYLIIRRIPSLFKLRYPPGDAL